MTKLSFAVRLEVLNVYISFNVVDQKFRVIVFFNSKYARCCAEETVFFTKLAENFEPILVVFRPQCV